MALSRDQKSEIIQVYHTHESDTGSPEVQIALLTTRINSLVSHLQEHKHDEHSRRGLLKLVARRRHLASFGTDPDRYRTIIERSACADARESGREASRSYH